MLSERPQLEVYLLLTDLDKLRLQEANSTIGTQHFEWESPNGNFYLEFLLSGRINRPIGRKQPGGLVLSIPPIR